MPTLSQIQKEALPPIGELVREHERMKREMLNPGRLPIVSCEESKPLAKLVLDKELRRGSITNCRNAYMRIRARRKGAA